MDTDPVAAPDAVRPESAGQGGGAAVQGGEVEAAVDGVHGGPPGVGGDGGAQPGQQVGGGGGGRRGGDGGRLGEGGHARALLCGMGGTGWVDHAVSYTHL